MTAKLNEARGKFLPDEQEVDEAAQPAEMAYIIKALYLHETLRRKFDRYKGIRLGYLLICEFASLLPSVERRRDERAEVSRAVASDESLSLHGPSDYAAR